MTKRIIGIHGLANKPQKSVLEDWWRKSIEEGLKQIDSGAAVEFKMVFWADLLYKELLHDDADFHFDDLYNNQPYVAAVKGAIQRHDDSFLDAAVIAAAGLIGDSLDGLKEHFGFSALADRVLGKTLRDLAFYYDESRTIKDRGRADGKVQDVLRDELKNVLESQDPEDELMLIAHSMGSIIAYDVLRDLGRKKDNQVRVKHLVTIGSPLGLPHVYGKIKMERDKYDGGVRTPTMVTDTWRNYADRKDPVALDAHLRDDFKANDADVSVEDDLIINDYVYKNAKGKLKHNHHKSYGYLRTPELSEHIAGFLESQ